MLFLVSGLVIVSGIIQMANNNRTKLLPQETTKHFYEQQARNISISLVDNAIQNLLYDMQWTDSITTDHNYPGKGILKMYGMNSSELTTIDHSVQNWNEYKVLFVSEATYGGYTVETEVLMQRDSFSKFSYFSDAERTSGGTEIWFGGNDVLTGPIHTNGTFRMRGSPTFNGLITSPNNWIAYNSSTSPNFNGGSNFNMTRTRDLPDSKQIKDLTDRAQAIGLTFNSDAWLEFYVNENEGPDGTGYVKEIETSYSNDYTTCKNYNMYYPCRYPTGNETSYKLSDYQGIISIDGEAYVKGTLKGKATLHSSHEINVVGDINYHTDPETDPNSTDLLGLVSEGDVVVSRYANTDHGSLDVTIHASIMALGTSFRVDGHDTGSYSGKGTLNILGGIIQKTRGPVGLTNGRGYDKNYVYDTRLLSEVPPEFPRESIFTIVYWKDKPAKKAS